MASPLQEFPDYREVEVGHGPDEEHRLRGDAYPSQGFGDLIDIHQGQCICISKDLLLSQFVGILHTRRKLFKAKVRLNIGLSYQGVYQHLIRLSIDDRELQ